MSEASWIDFYRSDLQAVYLLQLAPLAFLLARAARLLPGAAADPGAAGFVRAWSLVFAVETLLDPWASGPLVHALGWTDTALHTAVMVGFVLLGDFRVYLLLFRLASRERALRAPFARAARWTLVVPLAALALDRGVALALPERPGQTLWLVYELLFAGVALHLRARLPRELAGPHAAALARSIRAVCAYAALYYALWALADVLILSGVDAGWGLRVLPNQLYYGFTVPFVWWAFFARGSRLASFMASK